MWTRPGYEPPRPEPPPEQGRRLAEIPRGRDAVLRINMQEYEGRPYVSLRVWERGQDGQLWPVKGKGCSIRLSEIAPVLAALRAALDQVGLMAMDGERPGAPAADDPDRPRFVDRSRRRGPRVFNPGDPPATPSGSPAFDEFQGHG